MKRVFNVDLLYKNLRFLAKRKKIKISDIEAECGISNGYLTKLTKMDKPNPSIELIICLANIFEISVDDLLSWDFEKEYENTAQEKIRKFILKLINETSSNRVGWCDIGIKDQAELDRNEESDALNDYFRHELYWCDISPSSRLYIVDRYVPQEDSSLKDYSCDLFLKTSKSENLIAYYSLSYPNIGECAKELFELRQTVEKKAIEAEIDYETNEVISAFLDK